MNRTACQYAIVRFAPFVETGEFANVGVLMIAPKARFFGFRLETRRYGRITRFFEELDPKAYLNAVKALREELERVHGVLKAHGFDGRLKENDTEFAGRLFSEVVRPRESVIRFSEVRTVLAEEPKEKLEALFAYYVGRNFVTKERKEQVLESEIRRWLFQADLAQRFHRAEIGDDEYQAIFPFVERVNDRPVKVIKPLYLGQDEPSRIIDHSGNWAQKLDELEHRRKLPRNVLFAVEGPGETNDGLAHAYRRAIERLEGAGAIVTERADRTRLLDFAREDVAAA